MRAYFTAINSQNIIPDGHIIDTSIPPNWSFIQNIAGITLIELRANILIAMQQLTGSLKPILLLSCGAHIKISLIAYTDDKYIILNPIEDEHIVNKGDSVSLRVTYNAIGISPYAIAQMRVLNNNTKSKLCELNF